MGRDGQHARRDAPETRAGGRRRAWATIGLVALTLLVAGSAGAAPATDHPRLWVRPADLPRLRSWASPGNPVYQEGLRALALDWKARMDDGSLVAGDSGSNWGYTQYPVEWAAELFAFMSLIESDPASRADYAARARTLLMYVMNQAAQGPASGQPFREPVFSTDMRSLFYGEAFPLTVDWIYPVLTPQDKITIRKVFLRWIGENLTATTSGYDHPDPVWVLNDPVLAADLDRFRTSANNFYNAHMNQIGLMALALDPADDVGPKDGWGKGVRDYLADAIGAWLYLHHRLMESWEAGGVPPEGLAYGPTGLGRAAELLLALHTAGQDDVAAWGPQVSFDTPFWDTVIPAYLHSSSPATAVLESWRGTVYLVADHGDTYDVYLHGLMTLVGTMGLHAASSGNAARLNAARWVELHMAPGGAARLLERAGDANYVRDCLLYFLLFDPEAPPPVDPRPGLPLHHLAPGIGKLLARTGWDAGASWFTYQLGWKAIDHQFANGNAIALYRQGQWLTKPWAGYGETVAGSDYQNTLAIENTPPQTGVSFWQLNAAHGSQFLYGPGGDPALLASSVGPGYVHAHGDATNLYNAPPAGSTDVLEASRAVVWLQPDTVVVYDRARTATAGRFKRFWLNVPELPILDGSRAVVVTGSQQLVVDTLLPLGATAAVDTETPHAAGYEETANYEPMQARLRVDAPGNPGAARFLHVLQGTDQGVAAPVPLLVASSDGTPYEGAAVGDAAVLFPVDRAAPFAGLAYQVPPAVSRHYVAGLAPGAGYTVSVAPAGDGLGVAISVGGDCLADAGGLLAIPCLAPGAVLRPVMTAPGAGTHLVPGGTANFAWTPVPGAVRYGLEYTGPDLVFANPNGDAPDPVNGYGGSGGAIVAGTTSLAVTLPAAMPSGHYQVRVAALTADDRVLGTFSDAVPLVVEAPPAPVALRPVIVTPADGIRLPRGSEGTLAWTEVPGAVQYGVEYSGVGLAFGNPNGAAPDPIVGYGGAGGGLLVVTTSLTGTIPATLAPGAYQLRVIGLDGALSFVGGFSDAITVVVE